MRELKLDLAEFRTVFVEEQDQPFLLIKVPAEAASEWAKTLAVPVRRCYLSDDSLRRNAERLNRPHSEIIEYKLPDPGSVMAGDFGEILTAIFLASKEHPTEVRDPKKWRLKVGHDTAAPHSDIVQFILPEWPASSAKDRLICAEVKTKATNGGSTPIESSIIDSRKDQNGRLNKTLLWLKERALTQDLGTLELDQIERFSKPTDHPPAVHDFRAVAVICSGLLDNEIVDVQPPPDDECTLVVISIPDLKATYEALYAAIVDKADLGAAE